jgi:hypothetical protein
MVTIAPRTAYTSFCPQAFSSMLARNRHNQKSKGLRNEGCAFLVIKVSLKYTCYGNLTLYALGRFSVNSRRFS